MMDMDGECNNIIKFLHELLRSKDIHTENMFTIIIIIIIFLCIQVMGED